VVLVGEVAQRLQRRNRDNAGDRADYVLYMLKTDPIDYPHPACGCRLMPPISTIMSLITGMIGDYWIATTQPLNRCHSPAEPLNKLWDICSYNKSVWLWEQ